MSFLAPSPHLFVWNKAKEILPKQKQKVLILRSQRGKYTIGHYAVHNCEEFGVRKQWVTEHGSCFDILPEDAWCGFIPYRSEKVYD
jgi:hypothetical protein